MSSAGGGEKDPAPSAGPELELADALERIAPAAARGIASERVPLAALTGRILAADVVAALDLPAEDVSAMDGYALRAADCAATGGGGDGAGATVRLALRGSLRAGQAGAEALAPGSAIRIMTGAPVPVGADAVIAFEDEVSHDDASVEIRAGVRRGANIRPRGEHVRSGEIVLRAGRRLSPVAIGFAASLGCAQLEVFARLRVGVFSTGDELRDAPAALGRGASYDGNRPMILAALARAGLQAIDLGICADEPGVLETLLESAEAAGIGMLLTTGGAAMGEADLVRRLPGARFLPLRVRPGRGVVDARGLGRRGGLRLLGLPGNPVAAWALFLLLARPALLRLAGADAAVPEPIPVALAEDANVRAGRIDLRRARLVPGAQGPTLQMVAHQGSAMMRGACDANAIAAIGPQPHTSAGTLVPAWPLDRIDAS
jgi:molybdopterin molybdotransferase